ncbi:MAG: hypothetical protein NT056_09275 [Proteobacteria bacterium]|nr:hypothetical protein [Pseudomonadota bacterium]
MTPVEAKAEIFWTAFKSLPRREQNLVLTRLASDRSLRRDLMDISIAMERMNEPTRPLVQVLEEIRVAGKTK